MLKFYRASNFRSGRVHLRSQELDLPFEMCRMDILCVGRHQ